MPFVWILILVALTVPGALLVRRRLRLSDQALTLAQAQLEQARQQMGRLSMVASRINKPIGDKMIMNAAFLVSRDQETAFDARVKSIAAEHDKLTFKYTGPWPPYNFVNIRLKLERA